MRLSVDMDATGKILVEYRCDSCERTTVQHPAMVVHPVKPYPKAASMQHACDACLRAPARTPASPGRQLALGSRPA